MRVPLNDLARAHADDASELEAAVLRVVRSGWYVMGPEHDAFEVDFAAEVGVAHCVGVANGTDAIEIALQAAGLSRGDHVVAAANAGGYTSVACHRLGLVAIYADVDEETASLSAPTVEAALTEQTRAVVVTHLYGQLADVESLAALCRARGLLLIEDCAQAVGARRGKAAGAFGHAATFSFYPTKNLGALGDAGAIVTDDPDIAARARRLRQYGWGEKYVVEVPGGRNSRLDELQAAVLRVGLRSVHTRNSRRRAIAAAYRATLPTDERLIGRDDESFVAHLAVIESNDRDALRRRLGSAGIESAVHYPIADHRQPTVRSDVVLPTTDRLTQRILTIPCFPELTPDEVDAVCDALASLG